MALTRRKSLSVIYNGVEAWEELSPYMMNFTYTDSLDESDKISFSVSDRDLKWAGSWIPRAGDIICPVIRLENWNHEGDNRAFACGSFVVDDFSFSAPPASGSINGVSTPVESCFKETENTKTWEEATVRLVAAEIAGKYGLKLVYDAPDVPIARMEQNGETDSSFIKKLCEKYGLGLKVYNSRLVIWNYREYCKKEPVAVLTPSMVSKWSYRESVQGTYTGARVSYTSPGTKTTLDVLVGTEERLYRTTQKADNEADARRIGESAILKANRKAAVMQVELLPAVFLAASQIVKISGFGAMDGRYFIEKVQHSLSRSSYRMQMDLSKAVEQEAEAEAAGTESGGKHQGYTL